MKLLFFDDFKLGVQKGDTVVDVSQAVSDIPHTGPHNLISGLIERFGDYRGALERAAAAGTGTPLDKVRIRPPLPKPVNIDCMAVNYMEDGTRKEPAPINAFHKSPGCVIGDGDTMVLPDVPATIFEGEAELALVIGKRAANVPAAKCDGICLWLRELHRWIGARSAALRQHVLSDEVARQLRAHGPISRHGRRDKGPAQPPGQTVE